jgi:hypothetical protein
VHRVLALVFILGSLLVLPASRVTLAAPTGAAPLAAPAPDAIYDVPIAVRTQSGVVVTDGNGTAFLIGRAGEGSNNSTLIVQRIDNGKCVLCGVPMAYGDPGVVFEDGYYWITTVGEAPSRRVYRFRFDERYEFTRRPSLSRAALLPQINQSQVSP